MTVKDFERSNSYVNPVSPVEESLDDYFLKRASESSSNQTTPAQSPAESPVDDFSMDFPIIKPRRRSRQRHDSGDDVFDKVCLLCLRNYMYFEGHSLNYIFCNDKLRNLKCIFISKRKINYFCSIADLIEDLVSLLKLSFSA